MNIAVIGSHGLTGTRLLNLLRERGHHAVGADLKAGGAGPANRADVLTGEGLAQALQGAQVVIDVLNAPAWQYEAPAAWHDGAMLDFFRTSSRNIVAAARAAGVEHHVALSLVGAERVTDNGYFRAKLAQEDIVSSAGLPYTILRATPFFEFITHIADAHTDRHTVRVPPALMRPVAADDVVAALAEVTEHPPENSILELGGPELLRLDTVTRRVLGAHHDAREVIGDPGARYYGAKLAEDSLIPGEASRVAPTRFQDWLDRATNPSNERHAMKIVVIGGTGLVGSKLVANLGEHGHEALAAAPNTGVNTLTGEGLADAVAGASVVVDVSNSPSFEDEAVMEFFDTSTRNLLEAEAAAGVGHHVALSVVGTERLSESGYFRAKIAQEKLIKGSAIPFSIVHATQFFEFMKSIADAATDGETVRLPPALIQPMAAEDVARAVGRVAVGTPVNGTVEIAGPDQFSLDELVRRRLSALGDPREVVTDPQASYFGVQPGERTLLPGDEARIAETRFEEWAASLDDSQTPNRPQEPHDERAGS